MTPQTAEMPPQRRYGYDEFMRIAAETSRDGNYLSALNLAQEALAVSVYDTPAYDRAAFAVASCFCLLDQADLERIDFDAWNTYVRSAGDAIAGRIQKIKAGSSSIAKVAIGNNVVDSSTPQPE